MWLREVENMQESSAAHRNKEDLPGIPPIMHQHKLGIFCLFPQSTVFIFNKIKSHGSNRKILNPSAVLLFLLC
jgi:hypothetical protein